MYRSAGTAADGTARAEQPMVPDAEFTSYYGRPVIKEPVWRVPDVPGYLFLGGLAGASSVLAAGSRAVRVPRTGPGGKVGAFGAISLSAVALVHDLGRPGRFVNMLRVFKPSSPMSVGSWLLAGYGPVAGAAAVSELTGVAESRDCCTLARGPARPGYRDLHRRADLRHGGAGAGTQATGRCRTCSPAASAAGGLGLLATHPADAGTRCNLAVLGATVELIAEAALTRRLARIAGPEPRGTLRSRNHGRRSCGWPSS